MAEDTLLTVGELLNRNAYVESKKRQDTFRRIGKVRRFVFHPTEKRVIGIIVKRPDVALMFHRSDLFVAIDRVEVVEDGVIVDDAGDSVDQKACRRLGVDWNRCLLWLGMEVVTESGQAVGRVGDVSFHSASGQVESIRRDEGAAARWLLGTESIPASMIRGFRFGVGSQVASSEEDGPDAPGGADDIPAEDAQACGAIVVDDDVVYLDAEGGLAEKAGAASAKAAHRGKQAFAKAKEQGAGAAVAAKQAAHEKVAPKMEELGEKAGEAVNKGAFATGRQIGRARGMFSGLVDEYRKGLEDGD